MIEIVFNRSAAGTLKLAQHYGDGVFKKPAIAVILEDQEKGKQPSCCKKQREKCKMQKKLKKQWESAVPLGGEATDVFDFSLGLWYGNIEEPVLSEKREQALEDLLLLEKGDTAAQRNLQKMIERFNEVRVRAENGESIRIWYSDSPNDRCGICWLACEMSQWKSLPEIFAIKLPPYCEEGDRKVQYRDWGEVEIGKIHSFLSQQKRIEKEELETLLEEWRNAQRQNSNLRVVKNGKIQSVLQDYYDPIIINELDKQESEFWEAKLIGLVAMQVPVSDSFVALRLEKMIEDGILKIGKEETPGSRSYRRQLKKEEK